MSPIKLSRREFLKAFGLSLAAATLPQISVQTAACPVTPIKGAITLFLTGSYLDVQFDKNPGLHENPVLEKTIDKTILKPLKPEGFPYSGAYSSNWLFVFDFGCRPPGPLTLTLSNKTGKKIGLELELFAGNRYAAILHGIDSQTLLDLFGNGAQGQVTLTLTDGIGKTLWQSGALKTYRPGGG
jgi:hypothetical protein